MSIEFGVGKFYICKNIPANRSEAPSFVPSMEGQVGEPMECISVKNHIKLKPIKRGTPWSWNKNWLEEYTGPGVSVVKAVSIECTCQFLINGCKCGAFQEEMKAKGRTYNTFLRAWMK